MSDAKKLWNELRAPNQAAASGTPVHLEVAALVGFLDRNKPFPKAWICIHTFWGVIPGGRMSS